MKKRILILTAVCAAACCLGACTNENENERGKGKEPVVSEYDTLNEMLNASYSQVVVTVKETFDESAYLKSEYTIQYSESSITVNYVVERFAELSLEEPSTGMKIALTGEVVIKDGAVVFVNGDDVHLSVDITKTGLEFKEEYFENIQLSGMRLKADVKNVSAFLGSQMICTDMKVDAIFLEVFDEIRITYTSERGNGVEYLYDFTL